MCRSGRIIALCFFSLLLFIYTVHGFSYETCITKIPVSFINDAKSAHQCVVCIEPLADFPAPDVSELTIENNENKSFTININAPGVYKYKLYRKNIKNEAPTNENIKYDDTVFYINITAICDESAEKLLTETTVTVNNGGKTESVVYHDKKIAEDSDTDNKDSSGDFSHRGSGRSSSITGRSNADTTRTATEDTVVDTTADNIEVDTEETSAPSYEDTVEDTSDAVIVTDDNSPDDTSLPDSNGSGEIDEEIGKDIKTGDSSRQELRLFIMLVSFVVYVLAVILEKKEKNKGKI